MTTRCSWMLLPISLNVIYKGNMRQLSKCSFDVPDAYLKNATLRRNTLNLSRHHQYSSIKFNFMILNTFDKLLFLDIPYREFVDGEIKFLVRIQDHLGLLCICVCTFRRRRCLPVVTHRPAMASSLLQKDSLQ